MKYVSNEFDQGFLIKAQMVAPCEAMNSVCMY